LANLYKLGLIKKYDLTGKNNPNFKHGGYCGIKKNQKEVHTLEYKKWRKDVLKRDNYTCKECGSKQKLNAHHIIPRREDKNNICDINFGITLCEPCHQKTYFRESDFAEKYFSLIQNTAKAGV
jgi:5-methylcytosine-specific restriction endonuclease McrA